MTTIESEDAIQNRAWLIEALRSGWAAWKAARDASRQKAARRAFLSQLDGHLLRDIGIEPDDVRDAMKRRGLSPLFYPIRSPRGAGRSHPK